jgi:predicted methyltransferase
MKKLLLVLLLAACVSGVEKNPETEHLIQLNDEPVGCVLTQRIEVDAHVRNRSDAVQFLENRIVSQPRPGNAYWITQMRIAPQSGINWTGGHSYIINANVYRCPEHTGFVTRSDIEEASAYQRRRR